MIQDSELRRAAEMVVSELENQEEMIAQLSNDVQNLEGKIESQALEIDQQMGDIEDLNARILELEEALADAHLTGQICEVCAQRERDGEAH